jgi:Short C-terminal domain
MSLIPPWLRPPRVRERLASYHLRSDVLDAAAAMASDQRSDIYVVRLESSLTDSETVLRMMDGRHARVMGLLVLTSERILFRSRRRTGPNFSVPLEEVLAIEAFTRWGTGTVCVITPYGSLTVDQILGRQGEMLADDALATVCGERQRERDPLWLLAELRALRDSGAISAAEFEIRKSAIWRDI